MDTATILRGSRPQVVGPAASSMLTPDLVRLVDRLVEAVEIREAFDPAVGGRDTAFSIRDLERELARTWAANPKRESL